MAEKAAEVKDLWFWYHDDAPVLRGLNLSLARGELAALAGANGSGKTTLVKHLNGLLRPRSGEVAIDGQDAAGLAVGELAQRVGFLFQHPEQQIFNATVREEVAFGPGNLGLDPAETAKRVDLALARFGLEQIAGDPPSILSYGLRRRITLASLAAMEPDLLVLDEPTVGLDATGRADTLAWMAELRAQGRTILLVTHDMGLVANVAERLVVLNRGQIVADGTPGELFQRPGLLAGARLVPPPVLELSRALQPLGLRGGSLTTAALCQQVCDLVERDRPASPPVDEAGGGAEGATEDTAAIAAPALIPLAVQADPKPPPDGATSETTAPSRPGISSESRGARLADASSGELYVPGDSWLHRMDPRSKLWAVLLVGILALIFKQVALLAALLIVAHLLLLSARVPLSRLRWLWARLLPLMIMILLLQPWFSSAVGPAFFQLGPLRLTVGGVLEAAGFALRTAALAFIVAVLLMTTDPTLIVRGLVKLGLPYPWGLTVGLALRYLPTTFSLYTSVSEAQQARGWIVGRGGFLRRARSYLPIMVATIIAALRLSDRLGLALAARGLGYPAPRTTLRDIHFARRDWLLVAVITAVLVALVALRYTTGFGSSPW